MGYYKLLTYLCVPSKQVWSTMQTRNIVSVFLSKGRKNSEHAKQSISVNRLLPNYIFLHCKLGLNNESEIQEKFQYSPLTDKETDIRKHKHDHCG